MSIQGRDLKLTPIEFNLLKLMMEHPGRVFSRNNLVARLQGYDHEGYDRTIDTHIKNLRRKIAAFLPDQEIICSVHGIGYKLNAHYEGKYSPLIWVPRAKTKSCPYYFLFGITHQILASTGGALNNTVVRQQAARARLRLCPWHPNHLNIHRSSDFGIQNY